MQTDTSTHMHAHLVYVVYAVAVGECLYFHGSLSAVG